MPSGAMLAPHAWIALLRIVVGAWFIKAAWAKVTPAYVWGTVPYPAVSPQFLGIHPRRVGELAAGNPLGWYREFLEGMVRPHAKLFATLQAYGEVAVGVGLVLGLLTGLAALVGLVLTVSYGLASQWMSFAQQGFHLLLVTSMLVFLGARAGRAWGFDGLLLRASPARTRRWLRFLA